MKRWSTDTARGRTAALALALLVVLGGCIFEPRDPEPPTSGESIPYLTPTEVQNTWDNMQLSLRYTDSYGWESSLAEDFRYFPDSVTEGDNPGVFDEWGFQEEVNFINGLYDSQVTIQAELTDPDFQIPDDSGLEVPWTGVIYFVQVTAPGDTTPTKYRATANILFIFSQNSWYIKEWRDVARQSDPEDETGQDLPSLGVLRANFASK